jgi:hypothetical protein
MVTFTFRGNANAPFRLQNGNVTAPSIAFENAPSSGFFYAHEGIGIALDGTEKVMITSNSLNVNGNVTANVYTGGSGSLITGWGTMNSTISNVQITDSNYAIILDDTAVSTDDISYILVNGSGFVGGTMVLVDGLPATSTSVVSYTQLRAQLAPKAAGTYSLGIQRADSTVITLPLGITFSPFPQWSTGSVLPNVTKNTVFSQTLAATEASGSTLTYALAPGSSLPTGVTLSSNGVLAGNITEDIYNTSVYTFTINAQDLQFQNTLRSFQLTGVAAFNAT